MYFTDLQCCRVYILRLAVYVVRRDPVQCQQEHATCRSCIQKYIVDVGQQCPTCLEPLSMQTLLPWPRILRNLQSELRIYCRFNADGCAAEVYLGDLANHERACKFNKADEVRRNSPSPDSESNLDSIASFTLFKGAYASLEPNDKIRALENYVSQHESGNRISWNITARSSLNARPSVDFGQVDRLALLSITKGMETTLFVVIHTMAMLQAGACATQWNSYLSSDMLVACIHVMSCQNIYSGRLHG